MSENIINLSFLARLLRKCKQVWIWLVMIVGCKTTLSLEHWSGIQASMCQPGSCLVGFALVMCCSVVFGLIFSLFLSHLSASESLSAPPPSPTVKLGHQNPSVLTSAELQEPEHLLSHLLPWKPLNREPEGQGNTLLWWRVPQAGSELAAKAVVVPRVLLGARLEAGTAGMWDKAEAGSGPEAAPGSFGTFLVGSEELSTCTRLGLPQFPAPRKRATFPPLLAPQSLCSNPLPKSRKWTSFCFYCCFIQGIWGFQLGWAVRENEEILSLSVSWCLLPLWLCTVGTAVISAPRCSQAPWLKQAFRWHSRACVFVFFF